MSIPTNDILALGLSLISIFLIYFILNLNVPFIWQAVGLSGSIITLIAEAVYFWQQKISTS